MNFDLFEMEKELLQGWNESEGREMTEEERLYYAAYSAVQELRLWKEANE